MTDKFAKRDTCEYCGDKMEAKYRNKRFCSDKCRTYFNRENKNKISEIPLVEKREWENIVNKFGNKTYEEVRNELGRNKPQQAPKKEVDKEIPQSTSDRPVKGKTESGIDFSIRLAEWQEKQSK